MKVRLLLVLVAALVAALALLLVAGGGDETGGRERAAAAAPGAPAPVPRAAADGPAAPRKGVTGLVVPFDREALYGRCVDAAGESLPDVHVWLAGEERSLQTDSFGRYRFAGLEPFESYALLFEREGLRSERRDAQPGHDLRVELGPAAALAGRVVDGTTGQAVPDAEVRAEGWRRTESGVAADLVARTDGEGRFRLEGLRPARRARIEVSSPSHAVLVARVEVPAAGETGPVEGPTLRLEPVHALPGRVLDAATGRGVGGAEILVGGRALARADEEGRFALRAALGPERAVVATVRSRGHCETRTRFLAGDPARAGGELTLWTVEAARLAGRALDPGGRPVPGLRVVASDPATPPRFPRLEGALVRGGPPGPAAVTDAGGRFTVEGVVPSAEGVRLSVDAPGWRTAESRALRTPAPGGAAELDLWLVPAGGVEGRVTWAGEGARAFVAWTGDDGRSGTTWTNDGGEYRFGDVPAGPVTLTARRDTRGSARDAGGARVVVPRGGTARQDLQLAEGTSTLAGRVVGGSGDGVPSATVVAEAAAGARRESAQARTDAGGAFSLVVPRDPSLVWTLVALDGARTARRDDVVAPATGLELRMPSAGTVRLRAVDGRTGEPPEHVVVRWRPYGEERWRGFGERVARDADDSFPLELPAGVVDLEASVPRANLLPAVVGGVVVRAAEPGLAPPEVRVALEGGVELELLLRSSGAVEPPRGLLALEPLADPSGAAAPATLPRFVQLGADGKARARALPPGVYRLFDPSGRVRFEPARVDVAPYATDREGVQRIEVEARPAGER